MEGLTRKPFEGVTNIVKFNWHFYAGALACILILVLSLLWLSGFWKLSIIILTAGIISSILVSLSVSHYVYDRSDLYTMKWLGKLTIKPGDNLININAGFDETSALLATKFPESTLTVFDFYDPAKHTEISIERARKTYSVYPGTTTISTTKLFVKKRSVDFIFLILSAHEIRDSKERGEFFRQLTEALSDDGKIIVTEHLRDFWNFLAYNIGFFHFFSKKNWKKTFEMAGLKEIEEIKITPFISTFILKKHGVSS